MKAGPLLLVLALLILPILFIMLTVILWNYALVPITGFGIINFWQAIGLLVLFRLLTFSRGIK